MGRVRAESSPSLFHSSAMARPRVSGAFYSWGIVLPFNRPVGSVPPDEKRCNYAMNSGNREQCRNYRQKESKLCSTHGQSPRVQNARQRQIAKSNAKQRALRKYERAGSADVAGAEAVILMLEERMGMQVTMVRALDEIVGKLTAENALRYEHRAGEQLRGELQAWLQLNQSVTKLGSDYLKIGLDERKVRIAEGQARVLIGVIQAVLSRLDLNSSQRRIAAQAVPEELERVAIEQGN